jgi:hypothetical protein
MAPNVVAVAPVGSTARGHEPQWNAVKWR